MESLLRELQLNQGAALPWLEHRNHNSNPNINMESNGFLPHRQQQHHLLHKDGVTSLFDSGDNDDDDASPRTNNKPMYPFRDLGSGDEDNFLVNPRTGEEYEPYSMAWRYLGVYVDCDRDDEAEEERQRRLSGDDDAPCRRKVLWAAYYDPEYTGRSIGEYQFYDHKTGEYDADYCIGGEHRRCAKLDCHEPDTHFELIGVFKETDGLEWFTEQLFKHQGYCLWGSQQYEFMQSYQLPTECTALTYPDENGNILYMHIDPQSEGTVGIGVYTDAYCMQRASNSMTIQSYIEMYYSNNNDDDGANTEKGTQIARAYTRALEQWNEQMNIYKTCQPCRTYTLYKFNVDDDDDVDGSGSGSGDERARELLLDRILENDGEGDSEQWGYDCYDDAGYQNCNQCYKFYTQTDMEKADEQDLMDATAQGSIVQIHYLDGEKYGKGGFYKRFQFPLWSKIVAAVITTFLIIGVMMYFIWHKYNLTGKSLFWRLHKQFGRRKVVAPLKQELHAERDLSEVSAKQKEEEVVENLQQTVPSSQQFNAPVSFNHNLHSIDQLTHEIQNEIADEGDLKLDTPMTRFRTL